MAIHQEHMTRSLSTRWFAVQPGAAVRLFHVSVGSVLDLARHNYIVAAEEAVLPGRQVVEQSAAPISLILNWKAPGE